MKTVRYVISPKKKCYCHRKKRHLQQFSIQKSTFTTLTNIFDCHRVCMFSSHLASSWRWLSCFIFKIFSMRHVFSDYFLLPALLFALHLYLFHEFKFMYTLFLCSELSLLFLSFFFVDYINFSFSILFYLFYTSS